MEYLVEYCAQNGHFSLRYLEKVALNWHSRGIRTPDEARDFAESFNSDMFSVMKAFGLGDRRPAAKEQQLMERWFREYGFSRELVLMACDRTISAIHTPSFQYADRILSTGGKRACGPEEMWSFRTRSAVRRKSRRAHLFRKMALQERPDEEERPTSFTILNREIQITMLWCCSG